MNIAGQLLTFPHEALTKKATSVAKNEMKGELRKVLENVKTYVTENSRAAGLALPQIGISKKAFVAKLTINEKEITEIFINPNILPFDREKRKGVEGCLSIPNEEFEVERFYGVKVIYTKLDGKTTSLQLTGRNARIVQHELDHLNGVLISQIGERVPMEISQ